MNSIRKTERFECDQCGRVVAGERIEGRWWNYPVGWFVREDLGLLACTVLCAEGIDKRWDTTGRRLQSSP